jgi:hypothetical protein
MDIKSQQIARNMPSHQPPQKYDSLRSNIIKVKRKLVIGLDLSRWKLNGDILSRSHEPLNNHKSNHRTEQSSETQRSISKCVTFSFVEIREYGRILSDHPECKDGLAIGIDWKHTKKSTRIPIDVFEMRKYTDGKRVDKSIEKLSTLKKKELLINIGGYPTDFLQLGHRKRCLNNNAKRVFIGKSLAA